MLILGLPINNEITAYDPEKFIMGTTNDYLAGKESGAKITDQMMDAYSSACGNRVNIAADYTSFDVNSKNKNTRTYELEGFIDGLVKCGLDGDFNGIPGGLVTIVKKLLGKGLAYDAFFISGKMPAGFLDKYFPDWKTNEPNVNEVNAKAKELNHKFYLFKLDQLLSGELTTLSMNCIVNMANFLSFFEAFPVHYMHLVRLRIQGDDSIATFELLENEQWTLERQTEYEEAFIAHSAKNGLPIKSSKAVTRMMSSNFVQVEFLYGYQLVKPITQWFAAEKVDKSDDYFQKVLNVTSKASLMCSRGANSTTIKRWIFWYHAIALRSVSNRSKFGESSTYYLPQTALYIPKMYGGAGTFPGITIVANCDSCLVEWIEEMNDSEKIYMSQPAKALQAKVKGSISEVADLLNSNSKKVTPNDPLKKGRDLIRSGMPMDRVERSKVANAVLKTMNVDLGSLAYTKYPYETMRKAMESNASVRQLSVNDRWQLAVDMINLVNKEGDFSFTKEFIWVRSVRFHLRDVVEPLMQPVYSPKLNLDRKINTLLCFLGLVNTPYDLMISTARIMTLLRGDPFFPKDIREESIIKLLADPKLFGNPQAIFIALLGIGVREDIAIRVSAMFMDKAAAFMFSSLASGISLNDPALIDGDQSEANHDRFVTIGPLGNRSLSNLFKKHALCKSIIYSQFEEGMMRKVEVEINDDTEFVALSSIFGKNIYQAVNKFMKFYPNIDWSKLGV